MFNVKLAGGHLYGKWLFTWLSLVMSLTMSYFVLCPFSHNMSWMKYGTELNQFLKIFLPTFESHELNPITVKILSTESGPSEQ